MRGPLVGFTGPRDLGAQWSPLVAQLVQAVLAAGRGVAVGDARGLDRFVRQRSVQAGHQPTVFSPRVGEAASFCPCFQVLPAPPGVPSRFSSPRPTVRVSFSGPPGGKVQVVTTKPLPFAVALARRSAAMVSAVRASGAGAGVLGFLSRPCPAHPRTGKLLLPAPSSTRCFAGFGSGTWATLAFAVGVGLPVVVFPCGLGRAALPSHWGGTWQAAAASGPWSLGYRFVPVAGAALGQHLPQPWQR